MPEQTTPGPNQTAAHISLHAALEAYEKLLSNRHATASDFLNYGRSAQEAFSAVECANQNERDWLALLKSQAKAKAAQKFEEARALHQFAVSSIDVNSDFAERAA